MGTPLTTIASVGVTERLRMRGHCREDLVNFAQLWSMEEAQRREDAALLMTRPGIGPVNALASVLAIGPVKRFLRSKKIASYLGLNPSEKSSGGKRRNGAISLSRADRNEFARRPRTCACLELRFDREIRAYQRELSNVEPSRAHFIEISVSFQLSG